MAVYRRAPALDMLVAQVNERWPLRDKASDGWIGDAAHRNRVSDHNPDPRTGIVHAQDIDDDLAPGVNSWQLANELLASGDHRIKYVISHGRISHPDRGRWANPAARWNPYAGVNAHRSHVHLSITTAGALDTSPWRLPMLQEEDMFTADDRKKLTQLYDRRAAIDNVRFAVLGGENVESLRDVVHKMRLTLIANERTLGQLTRALDKLTEPKG